jgi:hypothetical protein
MLKISTVQLINGKIGWYWMVRVLFVGTKAANWFGIGIWYWYGIGIGS